MKIVKFTGDNKTRVNISDRMLVREIVKTETEFPDLHLRIKSAREAAELSIQSCADLAKVSRQYWSQLENNRLDAVSIDLVRAIEDILGTKLI
ncbi:helix-turn-helix domain-containing protein [Chamaesiphon sp.]|uniref:helix-turn-helix domain-containing protein n=1 Tax=Chamaesiphon sp. TaxID=2814140 RepID=UPI0035933B3C